MQANINWLTDPRVFRVNRLDAHSDHVCYASHEELTQGCSSLRQYLDGTWQFRWSPNPSSRPAEFWREGYDCSGFGPIQVPGHIELQGHGQIHYINTLYPWDGHACLRPPEIDWEHTGVGSYVTTFDLEPGLQGHNVCISFQGVEKAFFLWLNGQFVGYAEDSFTPSEFDLTPYLRQSGNRLCVEVYQHSSASWLEDQDFFRFTGIFRSVFLYARPRVHLEDLWLRCGLQPDNTTGTLHLRAVLWGETQGCQIRFRLLDGERELLSAQCLQPQDGVLSSPTFSLPGIQPWCHDNPQLYQLVLELYDAQGQLTEITDYAVGFRRLELVNRVIYLNGQRLMINGVNRHEWNPHTGRAITPEDMTQAMDTFQRNNINAVRTSHYPNQSLWYHLCDRNGIYMMDETNLESHGSWQKLGKVEPSWNVPGDLPEWKDCVLDRAQSMFQRDKNHVSILFWSCGNESYAGENILAMANYFRTQDPSRLVHYEGVFHCRKFDDASDVESRMYASPLAIREYLQQEPQKPFLLCEYMHDMGNSLGGMESYIRLGEEFPMYQGGFIWDYMDQALWHPGPNGQPVLGYGGDFGDRQSNYAFSGNGIVFADGREKPAMQEVRYWYASPESRRQQDQANTAAAAAFHPDIACQEGELTIIHGDGAIGVRGSDFEILFSYAEGGPVSLVSRGHQWLWRAPRPIFWRAPTENDMGNGFAEESAIWSAAEAWQKCSEIQILEESRQTLAICYTYTAPAMPGLKTQVIYRVFARGELQIQAQYFGAPNRPELPLFGLGFETPEPVDAFRWTGLSGETYPDRKKGGIFGEYTQSPHIPAYLVPQECGCHVDTHRTVLQHQGHCLTLERGERPYAFSVLPWTPLQLSQAHHIYELPVPCRSVVRIFAAMRGVGGIDSWGSNVEAAYRVSSDEDIKLDFRVKL